MNFTTTRHPLKLALADLEHQAQRLDHLAQRTDPELARLIATTRAITTHRIFRLSTDLREAARRAA